MVLAREFFIFEEMKLVHFLDAIPFLIPMVQQQDFATHARNPRTIFEGQCRFFLRGARDDPIPLAHTEAGTAATSWVGRLLSLSLSLFRLCR